MVKSELTLKDRNDPPLWGLCELWGWSKALDSVEFECHNFFRCSSSGSDTDEGVSTETGSPSCSESESEGCGLLLLDHESWGQFMRQSRKALESQALQDGTSFLLKKNVP